MKLSKLTYHNGAIKIEVYQNGQDIKRWNTGVRVDRELLNKDKFINLTTPLIGRHEIFRSAKKKNESIRCYGRFTSSVGLL